MSPARARPMDAEGRRSRTGRGTSQVQAAADASAYTAARHSLSAVQRAGDNPTTKRAAALWTPGADLMTTTSREGVRRWPRSGRYSRPKL
jgi:hypothetical protein